MAADQAIMIGLGVVFFGLLTTAFKLNESKDNLSNYVGVIFLALSLGILQIISWTAIEIAQAAGMTYFTNGATLGLLWVVNIAVFLYWLTLFIRALYQLGIYTTQWFRKQLGHDLNGEL